MRKRKIFSLDKLNLSNPQKAAVTKLMTAQKNKYKKLLHETHERLHIIADMTTSLEFWYNVNGNYEFISPSCLKITGYEPQEFISHEASLEALIHPDFHARFRADRTSALEGESGHEVEYGIVKKDGEHRWVKATWFPVLTRKEKHIGIRISIRDITEFKRCQLLARAYEQLTDFIADELVNVGIFSINTNRDIISWNAGCQRLLGYSREEAIDSPLARLFDSASKSMLDDVDFSTMKNESRFSISTVFQRKDGPTFDASLMFFILRDHKGHLYQLTCLLRPDAGIQS